VIDLALLALVAGAGRVVVESGASCPTAAEVAQRLEALLPPLPPGEAPARATWADEGGQLRVRLGAADGAPLAERALAVEASCADRANVIAVVIAAWDVEQRAEHVADPSLPHAARAPAPPSAAPAITAAAPPPSTPSRLGLELALGPALTFADGGVAPGAALTAALWGRGRLGARVALGGLLPRSDDVGTGSATWTRVGAAFEVAARASGRLGRLDAHAGVVAGAVVAAGSGFDLDHTTGGFSPGAVAGVDWSHLVGRFFVGAGASLSAWTSQRLVSSAEATATRALPRWQPSVDVAVGAVF
jgi:hypothetical protein